MRSAILQRRADFGTSIWRARSVTRALCGETQIMFPSNASSVPNDDFKQEDLRTFASRSMVAQDARWLCNALISARNQDGAWPITLFGHASRVVFEGSKIARDLQLGVPALAELLKAQHEPEIQRARQATKLLDDKLTPLNELQAEMAETYSAHHARFTGNAIWFARPLETDLGVAMLNDRVVAASIPLDRRFGLETLDKVSILSLSETLGGALIALAAMTGDASKPTPTVNYDAAGSMSWHDRLTQQYLKASYEPAMALETKLILLLIESEVATSLEVLPRTAGGFGLAVFRSQIVVLFHALSALEKILAAEPALTRRSDALRDFLQSPSARYFLEDAGFRMIRNYSMHYGVRDPKLELTLSVPMFGIVEALSGRPIAELAGSVVRSTNVLADILREWRK